MASVMADSCSWSSGEFTYSSTVANLVKPAASPSVLSWELSSAAGSLLGSSAWELGSWASLLGSSASELLSAVWEPDWLAGAELCGGGHVLFVVQADGVALGHVVAAQFLAEEAALAPQK